MSNSKLRVRKKDTHPPWVLILSHLPDMKKTTLLNEILRIKVFFSPCKPVKLDADLKLMELVTVTGCSFLQKSASNLNTCRNIECTVFYSPAVDQEEL